MCQAQNDVTAGPGVVEGRYHRLRNGADRETHAGLGAVVPPTLQVGMARQDEVGHRGGLIQETGQADNERNFCHRLFEASGRGQVKHRVGAVDNQYFDLAVAGILGELAQHAITCLARMRGGTKSGRRIKQQTTAFAQVSHQVIERVNRNQGSDAVTAITGRSATDGQAWLGIGKGISQSGDGVWRYTGLVCHPAYRVRPQRCNPVFTIIPCIAAFGNNVVG